MFVSAQHHHMQRSVRVEYAPVRTPGERGKIQNGFIQVVSMSAEPGRTKAYSPDLRWRVVWQRIAMDLTYRDIAERLSISVGTAYNIFQIFQRTGSVDAKPPSKRPTSISWMTINNYTSYP